ncbi:MAG TPA: hypothetical protein VJ761_12315 [Ktedonobacteraceae bacterium]|nr:hypothetical protein [Ktedonobacteraceae bacterium]
MGKIKESQKNQFVSEKSESKRIKEDLLIEIGFPYFARVIFTPESRDEEKILSCKKKPGPSIVWKRQHF